MDRAHDLPQIFAVLLRPGVAIQPEELDTFVRGAGEGAVVTFAGIVRPLENGKPIEGLEYEWHATLAERELQKVVRDVASRYNLLRAACAHRTGFVAVGEPAVYIAVSALHRQAAFEACAALITELKRQVPIWKVVRGADFSGYRYLEEENHAIH
ncbi:MAG: molybdenum cofactor biosynthesis protein MoaE [Candidatus Hydrogenedentota bacterium]|jgi:molybdopterin synthase catalytic subunit|uniref:Molybdenum cofactor biosynthesis protein MoaE n=1 Tax=Sumerlaea chitinivorans TaxID=2250252 RepID=A0A2Z4Y7P2_SUMC1|nr:Molybdenum cofactor biosynthesis protein MoaE [Candidatus Sumerlaea chitinivorans]RMH25647.1 MAG: molybdenum cofactor biosynthesis protein MoaE [Candidatus Hydrogenedentota bacterium]GIX43846.1 MAG: molybdopterin-converting factor chain 2 [Candidatus Sumerlaea sp.]